MIYFVRHGQTNANREGLVQGRINLDPLNALDEIGRSQAKEAAGKIRGFDIENFNHAFCSNTLRAEETAKIILSELKSGVELIVEPQIIERDYGPWDNKLVTQLPENIYQQKSEDLIVESSEMETYIERHKRVLPFLKMLKTLKGNILVVAHGGIIRDMLTVLEKDFGIQITTARRKSDGRFDNLKNCEIVRVPFA